MLNFAQNIGELNRIYKDNSLDVYSFRRKSIGSATCIRLEMVDDKERFMKRILFLIITLMLLCGSAFALSSDEKYSYVVVLDGNVHEAVMDDSLFYKISRKVVFPVNKYNIPQNSKFRKELLSEILPYFDNGEYILQSMLIRGAASPEGPYGWNCTLSQLRRKALLKLISDNVKHPIDSFVNVKEVPEDYVYLLLLMKERHDKDYSRVAAVVEKYIDTDQERLKNELMAIDGKQLWNRLLRDYFPEMRAARVVLFFKRQVRVNMPQPTEVDFTPKMDVDLHSFAQRVAVPTIDFTDRLPRREVLSVKTNLLLDAAYMPFGYDKFCPIPNVAIEYYPLRGHFTFGASFDCPWWQNYKDHKYFQVRNYQVEARYYFRDGSVDKVGHGNGAAYRGWYLQAYAHTGLFGICFDEKRGWEGEGFGGGLGVGYVLPLTKKGHWRLEFGLQAGVFWTKYDPYQYESVLYPDRHDNLYYYKWNNFGNYFSRRKHNLTWIGPTRVGITLSYDLLYRPRKKKGVSFKSWEVMK